MNNSGGSVFRSAAQVYPEVATMLAAARAGLWDDVIEQFDAIATASDRAYVLDAVAEEEPHLAVPDQDLTTERGRTLGVLKAHTLVVQAWRARTHRQADQVDPDAWERFRELLVRAERILVDITALDPSAPAAWSLRITTSMGLQLGVAESRRRYDHLAAVDPFHVTAQRKLLQELCPKWHGDWPAVFAFARDASSAAPAGSLAHLLVVAAHLEGWADKGPDYLKQEAVIDEVKAAAQQSVLHPDSRRAPGWLAAHSDLALLFSLADLPDHAVVHFDALGDSPVEATWSYLENPAGAFEHRRDLARKAGAAR